MQTPKPAALFLLVAVLTVLNAAALMARQSGNVAGRSQPSINCDSVCVVSIVFDTVSRDSLYVTIDNNDTNFINYPIVQLIDTLGDTVANAMGYFYQYGQLAHTTQVYQIFTTLTSFPANWQGKVRLEDGLYFDACIINFPCNQTSTTINGLLSDIDFEVFPNPVNNGELTISGLVSQTADIKLLDVTGRLIMQRESQTTSGKTLLNLSSLSNGLYFLILNSGNKKGIRKVLVNN